MKRSDDMQLIRTFTTVVKLGSMSRASIELGLAKSSVMRQVAVLEERLGCVLLQKSVKGSMPTTLGRAFLRESQELLTAYEKATEEFFIFNKDSKLNEGETTESIKGTIHVSVPFTLGTTLLVPWITQFQTIYQNVFIDLSLSIGPEHILASSCDVRFTHGAIPAERVKTTPLGWMPRCMVASPTYLSKKGAPQTPKDLVNHDLLGSQDLIFSPKILLHHGNEVISVPFHTRLRLKDHSSAKIAALSGAGIAVHALRHDVDGDLKLGRLIEVLPDWSPDPCPINILFPLSHPIDPVTQLFTDFVKNCWAEHPLLKRA